MLFVVSGKELSSLIVDGSYNIESLKEYEEWKDANYSLHRKYIRSRVEGSLQVVCDDRLGINSTELLEMLEANTQNDLLMCTLWINNESRARTVECYYEVNTEHRPSTDLVTINIQER